MSPKEILNAVELNLDKGIYNWRDGNFKSSRDFLLHALDLLEENTSSITHNKTEELSASIYFSLSNVERDSKNLNLAKLYLEKSQRKIQRNGTEQQFIKIKTNLGLIEEDLGNFKIAESLFLEILNYWNKNEDYEGIANALLNLSLNAFDTQQYDLAHERHMQALKIYEEYNMLPGQGKVFFNEGNIYKKLSQKKNALSNYCKSLKIFFESSKMFETFLALSEISYLILEKTPEESVMIFGCANNLKNNISLAESEDDIQFIKDAKIILEDAKFNISFNIGQKMEISDAVILCLRLKESIDFE